MLRAPQGEIVWRFLPKDAPEHVAYVKKLIAAGFYDGTTFHRVIPHFVVQGGDPNSKNGDRSDDGEGEADRRLQAEFSARLHYRPGTVGMARDADPNSGSCQFFIALENLPRLDGRYSIFAEVISGLEVARRIASLPRDLNDNPLQPVAVTVRLEKRTVRDAIASLEPGMTGSGEVLTGPDKPKPFDPKNRLWSPPALQRTASSLNPGATPVRLEFAIGADGKVLDVRFPRVDTPDAARLEAIAATWSFTPAVYDGAPRKARFEMDTDGGHVGPPTGGGAPIDLAEAMAGGGSVAGGDGHPAAVLTAPRPALRVTLPAGAKPPARTATLRLTIDAAGAVSDAALQISCGDATLDALAVEAARGLAFEPATRQVAGKKDPEPQAVYLELPATFVERQP